MFSAEQRRIGAWLGLLPHQTRRLTYPEAEDLLEADQRRFDRSAGVIAWLAAVLPAIVAHGVAQGIAAAFGENVTPETLDIERLARTIPGFSLKDT